jgi:hypothetical protein
MLAESGESVVGVLRLCSVGRNTPPPHLVAGGVVVSRLGNRMGNCLTESLYRLYGACVPSQSRAFFALIYSGLLPLLLLQLLCAGASGEFELPGIR